MQEDSERLRVGFDATALLGTRTGVGLVAAGMLTELAARARLELHAFAVSWRGHAELRAVVPSRVVTSDRRVPARLARIGWEHGRGPRAEHWTGAIDVLHAPNFVAPPARAPAIVTIHDLTFVRYPELCTADTLGYPRHIERALADGATVHAVSDFVAGEVREAFDVEPGRVVRIYAGLAPTEGGDAARGRSLAGAARYLLALGTIEPRKNLDRLVRAFDAVAGEHRDLHLALAGPDGWRSDAFERAVTEATHTDRIRRLGYVGDADRRDLLAGATALAYPSLYEGFGHPPLEAMAAGVPVVAAAAGALPEVLGDAALLPDPLDVDSIASDLTRAVGDEALRATLVERGRARVRSYSWARAGDELVELYGSVI